MESPDHAWLRRGRTWNEKRVCCPKKYPLKKLNYLFNLCLNLVDHFLSMQKFVFCFVVLSQIVFNLMAQLPETSIYIFEIQRTKRTYTLMTPKKISKKKGYNNQPYFSPDDLSLYYVSAMDTTNTEVMKYDLKKKKSRRLTKTKECEYSPKFSPDMSTITCVRVEQDKETQHLASYTLKEKKPLVILPELKSIGYYEWISQSEFISFELPEPFYLVKHNVMKKGTDTLTLKQR